MDKTNSISQTKNQIKKAQALEKLKTLDREIPSNPGNSFTIEEETTDNFPDHDEFKKIFNAAIEKTQLKAGQIIEGTILKLTNDHVIVNIQYKSEGIIPRSEFKNLDEQETELKVGQKIEVYIEQLENRSGMVILSKGKANTKKTWQNIIQAKENDEIIKGKVSAVVKGGLSVDIGVKAFLPGSQIDIRPVKNLDNLVGKTLDCKIAKLNLKRGNVILSRRSILEREREKLPKAKDLKEGLIVKGIVKNITEYGAFIDLGNKDGLLHITDMSWSRIENPKEFLRLGQELDLKILKIDSQKNRISLGLKQLSKDAWETSIAKYNIGSIVKAKVTSVVDYGAFMSLEEEGLEGLVHINEISWTRKLRHPSNILKAGDIVDVKIIDIKKEARKLALSIKQTKDNPWKKIKDYFKPGDVGEFEIVSISDFGIFVQVTKEIDGLIRMSDISWTENIKPLTKYKIGDKVKVKVLDIKPEEEKFSLGIKQMEKSPWDLIEENYPVGSRHEVEVVRVVDFGAFVKIKENIEGLIHKSELSTKRVNKPQDIIHVGDKVKAEILNIDKDAKKIGLSIRQLDANKNKTTKFKEQKEAVTTKKQPTLMENPFAKALKKSIDLIKPTSPTIENTSKKHTSVTTTQKTKSLKPIEATKNNDSTKTPQKANKQEETVQIKKEAKSSIIQPKDTSKNKNQSTKEKSKPKKEETVQIKKEAKSPITQLKDTSKNKNQSTKEKSKPKKEETVQIKKEAKSPITQLKDTSKNKNQSTKEKSKPKKEETVQIKKEAKSPITQLKDTSKNKNQSTKEKSKPKKEETVQIKKEAKSPITQLKDTSKNKNQSTKEKSKPKKEETVQIKKEAKSPVTQSKTTPADKKPIKNKSVLQKKSKIKINAKKDVSSTISDKKQKKHATKDSSKTNKGIAKQEIKTLANKQKKVSQKK